MISSLDEHHEPLASNMISTSDVAMIVLKFVTRDISDILSLAGRWRRQCCPSTFVVHAASEPTHAMAREFFSGSSDLQE